MAKTPLGAPQQLTPDTIVGPTDTPSATAPASSQWVADVADKAVNKDTDVFADLDTATPTDTNKVPNAADVKAKLDEKLDANLAQNDFMIRTDATGNVVVSALTGLKAEALETLTEAKIPTVDADGKLVDSTLTKAKAERLESLSVANRVVKTGTDGVVLESGIIEDPTNKRLYQAEAPLATADNDVHLLTKKDGDALYAELAKPLASFDVDADVNPGGFIPFTGSEIQINSGFTVQDGTDATDKFLRIDKAGYYRVTASLLGYSAESQDNTSVTTGTPGSVVFNKGASASVAGVRYHQIRWYSNTDESYKNLHASVVIAVNQNEVLSFEVVGLGVYGSSGDYSAINVEYIRPL